MDDSYSLRTPEQVELGYDVAGLGSRFLAALVDTLIQVVLLLALLLIAGTTAGLVSIGRPGEVLWRALMAVLVLLVFLILWGYFVFFELAWNGQTPGKRLAGIRVLTIGGQPITLAHALIRNLVRIVDFLPSSYMVGAVTILISKRSQRLGDLAAGTLVVRERREAPPTILERGPADPDRAPLEARDFTPDEVALARDFLLRRTELPIERRAELAERIAAPLRDRLGEAARGEAAETLLARVAALRR